MRTIVILVAVLALFGVGITVFLLQRSQVTEETLQQAQSALDAGQLEEAAELSEKYLREFPDSVAGQLVAGNVAAQQNKADEAYEWFVKTLVPENPDLAQTQLLCGRLALAQGLVWKGEQHMRELLKLSPDNPEGHRALFHLMRLEGRNRDLREHFQYTIRTQQFNFRQLIAMSRPNRVHLEPEDSKLVESARKAAPDDPLPLLGEARSLLEGNDPQTAVAIFNDVLQKYPQLTEVQGWLGLALLATGSDEMLDNWMKELPENADESADVWFVRGERAAWRDDAQGAARCFWEALKRDPLHGAAAWRLGRMLELAGRADDGRVLRQYATQLAELSAAAIEVGPANPSGIREIADGMKSVGRLWEAMGWCYAAMQLQAEASAGRFALPPDLDLTWAVPEAEKLAAQLVENPAFVLPSASPAGKLDLSEWDVPDFSDAAPLPPTVQTLPPDTIAFRDDASEKGIDHTFLTGISGRALLFEISGGGATVVDFDNDGWPDVYLSQGCPWPPNEEQTRYVDQLYRNLGGERFEAVSTTALNADNSYTQGVAAGDFDNDGFVDLYVGNIGPDRLYHNNGDGTFSEVPLEAASDEWTMSTLVGDLTGDGVPDLYRVGYLEAEDLFAARSDTGEQPMLPRVQQFPASADQLLVGNGDGTFTDITGQAGLEQPDGKGMGLIAFRRGTDARLSVAVSNDSTANFLFTPAGDAPQFAESSLTSGLGYGDDGSLLSSQGIAAGDVDNDGRVDILMTSYNFEPHNLYIQQPDGAFEDQIQGTGLRSTGFEMMGWGAQFLDANLDGHLDLLVANGTREEVRIEGAKSRMPTQFYANLGSLLFQPGEPTTLGSYFEREHYGRAVARLDWNRDGLPDALVTHVSRPVALLTNTTGEHGSYVRLRLVGTTRARDGIGGIVTLTTNRRKLTRQLIAGDGYQASNERVINLGVLPAEELVNLTVSWPGGGESRYEDVQTDTEYTAIEGNDAMLAIPR